MLNIAKNSYVGWLFFTGAIILLLEMFFFSSGLIFSLIISGFMVYAGRKKQEKGKGKWLYYGGLILLIISVIQMVTFKFVLFAILIHFFIQYLNSKKAPEKIVLEINQSEEAKQDETVIKTKPLFDNLFLGAQKTPQQVYEWKDINIQAGIGDTMVDLSYTMLPKGETVILIRNLAGNIQLLVPYDIEVCVQHSSLLGSTTVFEHHEQKIFNHTLQLKTAGYDQAEQKVKVVTSLILGNLEVSRI